MIAGQGIGTIAGHSVGLVAAVAGGMLLAALALAVPMRRRPDAFPLLAVLALPFRVPIALEGRTVNLLLPLYVVIAAGTLAHLLGRVLGPRRLPGRPLALDWLLAASVALYAIQIAYSSDHVKGLQNLVLFYVPFGLLYLLLRGAPWTRQLLLRCFALAVGLAVAFAGIGFVEYANKQLLLNPKVVAANQFDNYFRVNSLFFDPSIYGRFLAVVMLTLTTLVLWAARRRHVWLAAAALGWLLAGMVTSFSQSSIAALLVGLAVLAAWRWDVRSTLYVAGALVAIALVVVFAAPPSLHLGFNGSKGSTNNATSGRAKLISGGLKLFADRPLQGFGSGSFAKEYVRHNDVSGAGATSASHTIPITVAAEQGILGLALYVALVAVALATLFSGAGRSPPRMALAACLLALVVHTWAYADFLEDPLTWTLLGIGVALRANGWKAAPHAALPRAVHAPPGRPAHAPVGTTSEM
jgi:O-antigen ligase